MTTIPLSDSINRFEYHCCFSFRTYVSACGQKRMIKMLNPFKNKVFPTGIDLGSNYLRMAQLQCNGQGLSLRFASYRAKPDDIEPGSAAWQRWAAKSARELFHRGQFKNKKVVTALASDDVFIDQLKLPRTGEPKLGEMVRGRVQQKLAANTDELAIKYVTAETTPAASETDVVVMAAERQKVARHLAIFEKAGLDVVSIAVWPFAMINSYTSFFARRRSEQQTVTMLIDISTNHCNVAICKSNSLLFARVIPIGLKQLERGEMIARLAAEIDACNRYFESVSNGCRIERLMFLACRNISKDICGQIAKLAQKMQIPAQIGDVMAAIENTLNGNVGFDRRQCNINWATVFGLSLAGRDNGKTETF